MEPLTPPRHLIHVGYPKAGATFFKAWATARDDVAFVPGAFAGHPQVETLPDDLLERPDVALRVTSSEALMTGYGLRSRARYFRSQIAGDRLGERAEAAVAAREQTAHALAALFPTAHVLILLRGFRSSTRSLISQSLKRGSHRRIPTSPLPPDLRERWGTLYRYDRMVALYEAAFPGRVTVLPYELLRDDREAFVAALCRAGGIPYRPFDPGRVNAAPPPHALGLVRSLSAPVHGVVRHLPDRAARGVLHRYDRALSRVRSRPWFDRLGRALGVEPFPKVLFSDEDLADTFGGLADEVARRPEFAPYAAEYTFE